MNKHRLLEMQGMEKSFPGVRALKGVDLALQAGEVLALVGENGAGKSTLMKVLAGAHQADAGCVKIAGREVRFAHPSEARRGGIAMIYQELNLLPALSVRENLFLGQELARLGWVRRREERRRAREIFQRMGMKIDLDTRVADLSIAQQQMVEIGKALLQKARILILDEPTATLSQREVERLMELLGDLRQQGMGIIYISHRLDEVFRIANRVMVMRDGVRISAHPVERVTRQLLIEMMVGRKIENEFPKQRIPIEEVRLSVEGLGRGERISNITFSVHRAEVLGIAGLMGAGRSEMARLLFGAERADRGTIVLDGHKLNVRSPQDAIEAGICLLSEDRKRDGLVLKHAALHNFALPNLSYLSQRGFVDEQEERLAFRRLVSGLRIKVSSEWQRAEELSGGNQQKIVLAKWLERDCEVIIFDEPTRGVDVATKYEIYLLINDLAKHGKAIIMISSELPEILGMSDRILVMREGRIAGEIRDMQHATPEGIMRFAVP